jgi:hypothetical protein
MEIIDALYNSQIYKSFQEVIATLENSKVLSMCLSDSLYVSLVASETFPYILIRNHTPLAFYNKLKDTFYLHNKQYTQEVSDFIRRNGLASRLENTYELKG